MPHALYHSVSRPMPCIILYPSPHRHSPPFSPSSPPPLLPLSHSPPPSPLLKNPLSLSPLLHLPAAPPSPPPYSGGPGHHFRHRLLIQCIQGT
ncbi:unnamed protein product [Closterium sp. NIES-53]